jgi:hypothetical protein
MNTHSRGFQTCVIRLVCQAIVKLIRRAFRLEIHVGIAVEHTEGGSGAGIGAGGWIQSHPEELDWPGARRTATAVVEPHFIDCLATDDDEVIPSGLDGGSTRLPRWMPQLDADTKRLQRSTLEVRSISFLAW